MYLLLFSLCLVFNTLQITFAFPKDINWNSLAEGRSHVCTSTVYYKSKTTGSCSGWWGGRCTKYKSKSRKVKKCCSGWQNYYDDLRACNHAICNKRISAPGQTACTKRYTNDYIKYRSGEIMKNSGGTCTSPNKCSDCNDGFYDKSGVCTICPKIDNCYGRRCTSVGDNICVYCHGEFKSKAFWRAYTSATDEGKTCKKACSWRSDSTRCYPGHCSAETVDTCRCVKGFTGHHCDQITEKPRLLYNLIRLEDGSKVVENPANPNEDYSFPSPTVWTNEVHMAFVNVIFKAQFVIPEEPPQNPDITGENHYVTDWRKGIVNGTVVLKLHNNNSIDILEAKGCPGMQINPIPNNYECEANFIIMDLDIVHNDVLEIELSASNGGYVEVMDRDNDNKKTKHFLLGTHEVRTFFYHFDTEPPYQPCAISEEKGCSNPVTAPDFTTNSTVVFFWDGWTDDLSQLQHYYYEVFDMGHIGSGLTEKDEIKSQLLPLSNESTSFELYIPGMYSILFAVVDTAGNQKVARQVFLFDSESKVEKQLGMVSRVVTASENTEFVWVTFDVDYVKLEFKDRFVNRRHKNNGWLNMVKGRPDVDTDYDDRHGRRTVDGVDNVNGIVDFQVSFQVNSTATSNKGSRPLRSIPDIHDQADTVTINWTDGDKLHLVVRAIDAMDAFDEEYVTVYRDATPPVIQNLWLTRGMKKNIHVHSGVDFTDMTIEWDAFDYHSGLHSLNWTIYDNFTKSAVHHGSEDLITQGSTNTIAACQAAYGGDPEHCYCTPFWGCFHKHFIVKPKIKVDAGLIVGRDRGVHDYDYYIQVQVTNRAKLVTSHTRKVTIDVSPPHTGVVNDGMNGTHEVDYQQSKTLHAYWEGFFDRESGVLFYLYTFKSSCQNSSSMTLDSSDESVVETTSRYATHTVATEGTYYITVVAFNRALEPSVPVCSDGVTIDTTTSSIKEVKLKNAWIRGGLGTDPTRRSVWVLSNDRSRSLVDNVTMECWNKAVVISDMNLYPLQKSEDGNVSTLDGNDVCANTPSAPAKIRAVVTKSSTMFLEWSPEGNPNMIFDYEVGLTRTASGGMFPDIHRYKSTKQHSYTTISHADLPDGTEFYFSIKTISKSQVEGVQVIGPCIMDTTAPDHHGDITIDVSENYLTAKWSVGDFQDAEDVYDLKYHFALGSEPYSTDVQNYRSLREGGTCILTSPPTCTAALISELDWQLHEHHTYYVTVKAENTAGLFTLATSLPYVHDTRLPSKGVVLDIPVGKHDLEDIDFQTDTNSIAVRWSGFVHSHLNVTYRVCIGSTSGGSDVLSAVAVGTNTVFEASRLALSLFQTYYVTVEAVTSVGSVNVTSDGITIVKDLAILTGVNVRDGKPCDTKLNNYYGFSRHIQGNETECVLDIDYQTSLNSMQVYWVVPNNMSHYTPDVHWAVQIRSQVTDQWTIERDYQHISSGNLAEAHDFSLLAGRTYRSVIKFCAGSTCFTPFYTNGVTVLANPPRKGDLQLFHYNTSQLRARMDRLYDPDVYDLSQRYQVVDKYEWSLTENDKGQKIAIRWNTINASEINVEGSYMTFDVIVNGSMNFGRCRGFSVRGYNKAKLWTVVTANPSSCESFERLGHRVVIDAVGETDYKKDESNRLWYGKPIFIPENYDWTYEDADFTPYVNYISAVWPSLRYRHYKYAVIRDTAPYDLLSKEFSLSDPCSHPHALQTSCGITNQEFVNVRFSSGELIHGERYIVCIHASESKTKENEQDTLPQTSACSDGVVVDLTPPVPGNVWIGHTPGMTYQTTNTDVYIHWESFLDDDEPDTQSLGIQSYIVGVGSSPGGNDIVPFQDVGVTNHVVFNNLHLQNGHKYYATLTGSDFVGRVSKTMSRGIVIDTSPPVKSQKPIKVKGRHITSLSEVSACWSNVFTDPESGIVYYEWSVGSLPGYDDIMAYVNVSDVECAVSDKEFQLKLHEGHAYYISVKAYNGAGLFTRGSSLAYTVVLSPPSAGHVYDGKRNMNPTLSKDSDFQTDTSYIGAFWEGFHDPHSTIVEYRIRIGTCKQCQNVLKDQPIGIIQEFILAMENARVGLTYYTTVTACNAADLCTFVTSDGVILDDSPPTPGVVQDGTEQRDLHYQAERSYIGSKWFGFVDQQSGIDRYQWWAGTSPSSDDVMKRETLHLTEIATNLRIALLPLDKTIYITIRAYNKAGQYSQSTSNGFKIDITPPFLSGPTLSRDIGSIMDNSIVFRTSVKVSWTAWDKESFIERQCLSISAHRGSEIPQVSIQLTGIVRDYLFTGLDLHDGVKYFVSLIVCNGAGLCSHSQSRPFLVDSSPPSRGMFAVRTDNAANVTRYVPGYMTWTSRAVYLAWIGFHDLHSSISYYMISVGSSYMANDLISNGQSAVKINHSTSGDLYEEGHVQTAKIETTDLTKVAETLYISMYAVNSVGLTSPIIHSMFTKVITGSLELVRRCEAYTCMGHCICAPQDQLCPSLTDCMENKTDAHQSQLIVKDIVDLNTMTEAKFTPTDTCLSAQWSISLYAELIPLWYEWSVGFAEESTPVGIFNPAHERVWHDAGKRSVIVYTLPRGSSLHNGLKYSFFVRVWYTADTFTIFKSRGITVSNEQFTGRNLRKVVEYSLDTTVERDMDYLKYFPFAVSWKNTFPIPEDRIARFKLYISTYQGGYDVYELVNDLSKHTHSYEFLHFKKEPHVKYYFNVIAYTETGVHCLESSDGFLIDDSKPEVGVAYDGEGLYDREYQSSVSTVSTSWHGFVDLDSGIKSYFWCVGLTMKDSECTILPWQNVGLKTSAKLNTSMSLIQGSLIYNKVYALDHAGHASPKAVSDGIKIDHTPPVAEEMIHEESVNLVLNPSFEDSRGKVIPWNDLYLYSDICSLDITYSPLHWQTSRPTCIAVVYSDTNLAKTGRNMVAFQGYLEQTVSDLEPGALYRITFVTSHLPNNISSLANKEGFIDFSGKKYIFLLYTNGLTTGDHVEQNVVSWHLHTFYFRAASATEVLTIGCLDRKMGMFLDDVCLHRVALNKTEDADIHSHVVYLHDWSSIHGSWSFVEDESSIVGYEWAIGYTRGGTQIQRFENVGLTSFAYNSGITLQHQSLIYITVIATNGAGLQGVVYSNPILVDLTGPNITDVNDGYDLDLDSWELDDIVVNWKAEDKESGIKYCEWAVGTQPYGNEIQTFTKTEKGVNIGFIREIGYDKVLGEKVYSSIRCENNAGLQSVKCSDGVMISRNAPDIRDVNLQYIALSSTEYSVTPGFQSTRNQIRLKWTGFTDFIGIEGYLFTADGSSTARVSKKILSYDHEYTYVLIDKVSLTDGIHDVCVQAVNLQFKSSPVVCKNITVLGAKPQINASRNFDVTLYGSEEILRISWEGMFISEQPLYFEVCVGKILGGGDILRWMETADTYITFRLPPSVKTASTPTVFVAVRAVSVSGIYVNKSGKINFT